MGDISKHFSSWEFECRCGCGFDPIQIDFVKRLEKVRENFGPLTVNSGCRCERHNYRVGGNSGSSHLTGWAADLRCPNSFSRFVLIRNLIDAGFLRIGIGGDFVHVDADPKKVKTMTWLYFQ